MENNLISLRMYGLQDLQEQLAYSVPKDIEIILQGDMIFMIRIGILGYGNLGKGVEYAIKQNDDMQLAAVFTRRTGSRSGCRQERWRTG